MKKIFTLFIIVPFVINAQLSIKENNLNDYIKTWRIENGVQGISVSIYSNNNIKTIVNGWRSDKKDSLQINDSFLLGSVSKTFTAAAILKLVEEGVIKLNNSAAELSGLTIPKNITVSQLLYHEAGLAEYMGGALSFEVFLKEHSNGRDSWTSEEIRSFSVQNPVINNLLFNYSNSHFVILGAIIEKQTGKPLNEALNSLIFKPTKLNSARLIKSEADNPNTHGKSEGLKTVLDSSQIDSRLTCELATAGDAAGGIAINSSDLAIWAMHYFSGNFVDNLLFKTPKGGEAFGLTSDRIKVGPGVYEVAYGKQMLRLHGGDGLGSTALIVYDPVKVKAIAILVNDDKLHSLGFGKNGFLDLLAIELLK